MLAVLGAGGNGDLDAAAVDARNFDGAAERSRGYRQRHATMQVGALALEQRVGRQRQEDVEIARRCAVHADLALAGQPDAGAVLDPGRDVHREVLLLAHAAGAVAALAGLLDDFAGATAGMAGALDGEEALTGPHPPGATAGGAGRGLGALLAAAPLAGPAGGRAWHANGILLAGERLLQRDRHVVAQIGAAPARLAAAPASGELAEHLLEDVGEAAGVEFEAAEAARARIAVLERGMTVAVIGGALLIILEDVVGFVDFLELVLGRLVALIAVRVEFHGLRPIRLLDLVGVGAARDAE